MQALVRLSDFLAGIVTGIGRLAAWLSLPLAFVVLFDVVGRKIGYQTAFLSSTRLQELEWHIHACLFLLLLAWAYLRNAHVRIDIVYDRVSPVAQAWIELIGCLVFLIPYALLVIIYGSEFWWKSWLIDEGSAATTGLPHRWIIKFVMPFGFFLVLLAGVSMALNRFVFLFGNDDASELAARRCPHEPTR